MGTLLCRQMTRVHPVVSFTPFLLFFVTDNILEYKKKKTGIGEQSYIMQP